MRAVLAMLLTLCVAVADNELNSDERLEKQALPDPNNLNILVFVLCFDKKSCDSAHEFFDPHPWAKIVGLPQNLFFETWAFTNIFPGTIQSYRWSQYDFIGTVSWRAPQKFVSAFGFGPLNMTDIVASAPLHTDVIGLVGRKIAEGRTFLKDATVSHNKFTAIWQGLLGAFNTFTPEQVSTVGMESFLCNYWLAKPEFAVQLIIFIQKAHYLMENLESIQEDLWSNANYWPNKKLTMAVFNKPYYAYHPFILERLTPFFFNVKKANIHVYKYFGKYNYKFERSTHEIKAHKKISSKLKQQKDG